jgi:hypothetical protein
MCIQERLREENQSVGLAEFDPSKGTQVNFCDDFVDRLPPDADLRADQGKWKNYGGTFPFKTRDALGPVPPQPAEKESLLVDQKVCVRVGGKGMCVKTQCTTRARTHTHTHAHTHARTFRYRTEISRPFPVRGVT